MVYEVCGIGSKGWDRFQEAVEWWTLATNVQSNSDLPLVSHSADHDSEKIYQTNVSALSVEMGLHKTGIAKLHCAESTAKNFHRGRSQPCRMRLGRATRGGPMTPAADHIKYFSKLENCSLQAF